MIPEELLWLKCVTYALLNKNVKYASLTIGFKYESFLQSCSRAFTVNTQFIVMPLHRKFETATSCILGKNGGGGGECISCIDVK